ncbi:hypothetical protein QCN27_03125 [Cereibacter sp. SYSU M97828]|nr:hypothetical protein [Cereibacter flavus]
MRSTLPPLAAFLLGYAVLLGVIVSPGSFGTASSAMHSIVED